MKAAESEAKMEATTEKAAKTRALWNGVSTCGPLGFVPIAPGTAASLAIALLYKYVLFRLSLPVYLALVVFLFACGVMASAVQASALGQRDPRRIVIDEVCGQLIALAALPATWTAVGLAFLIFRLFDIAKPFPIRRTEKLPGGWGIMADDVLAGLMARLLLCVILELRIVVT